MRLTSMPVLVCLLILFGVNSAQAATCTSKATGNWSSSSTWTCTAGTIPASGDTVILASPYTVTLDNDYTVALFTINSGATLSDTNGRVLTVTGNITNNGTFTSSNNGGIDVIGASAIISGNGTFANSARIYTSGAAPVIAAGATLSFTGTSQIRAGRTSGGSTVSTSKLTISGTLNGSGLTSGTTFLRLYASNTTVSSTGIINAGTATIGYRATGTLTNNGNVIIGTISLSTGTGTWTNAANANLTVQTSFVATSMILNASATNNTVTYNSPATPITPSSNTYYNLAGTGVVCPVSYIILGTSPCTASLFVQGSPSSCTNATGVGTIAWLNPTNAYASDNIYATASNVTGNTTTNYLNCKGFNLGMPSGATISGITVYIERKTDSGTTLKDAFVYLIKGGTISTILNGATATAYSTADSVETHGGQNNLWGTTWTVADINSANFGVAFAAKNTSTTSTTNRTISIDQIQIRVDYTLPALHHIRIEHDGLASTCALETITLKACSNAACTTYYTGGDVTGINLSPTAGSTWTPGSTVSILGANGGINSSTQLTHTSGTATFAITGTPSPAPANAYECYNTATATSGDCNMVFSPNYFSFNALDHTSDTIQTVTVTSCNSTFANKTRSVKFWSTYVNPATGTKQGKVVTGTGNADCTTGYSALGTSSGSSTTLGLSFGSGAAPQATFSLCYPDVGAVKLDAQYNGSAATGDNGIVISGSDSFIAKPDHFSVSNVKRSSDNFANPAAVDATGGKFITAGDSTFAESQFTATITAKSALNATTPNYGLESEGVVLTVSSPIVAPAGGSAGVLTCKGSITNCVVPGGAANFSGGATTVTDLAWNEVGVMKIMAKISDGNYLGTGDVLVTTPNAGDSSIGRFYPHHFNVTPDAANPIENRSDWCEGGALVSDGVTVCTSPAFTYMGEKMNVQFSLAAKAAADTTTQNYITSATSSQNFAKLNLLTATNLNLTNTLGLGAIDPTIPSYLSTRLDTALAASGTFDVGVANVVAPVVLLRAAAPDGPYAALQIGVAPKDSDGVILDVASLDLDVDAIVGLDHQLIGGTEVRYGRVKLLNAFGSELLDLPMTMRAEYWLGVAGGWRLNSLDTSTNATLAFSAAPPIDITANTCVWDIGVTSGNSGKGCVAAAPSGRQYMDVGVAGFAGDFNLWLKAPEAGNAGSIDVTALVPSWLQYNWTGAVGNPKGRATFGVYKSKSGKVIHRREMY